MDGLDGAGKEDFWGVVWGNGLGVLVLGWGSVSKYIVRCGALMNLVRKFVSFQSINQSINQPIQVFAGHREIQGIKGMMCDLLCYSFG